VAHEQLGDMHSMSKVPANVNHGLQQVSALAMALWSQNDHEEYGDLDDHERLNHGEQLG
jgi:hypothetical protein